MDDGASKTIQDCVTKVEADRVTFSWNAGKERAVYAARRIDRAAIETAYADPFRIEIWGEYGFTPEEQCRVTCHTGSKLITFVYAERNGRNEIITAWNASAEERAAYDETASF